MSSMTNTTAQTADTSHLNALELRLSHERARLHNAKSEPARESRRVIVEQCEREIAHERRFIGLPEKATGGKNLTLDELAAELSDFAAPSALDTLLAFAVDVELPFASSSNPSSIG